MDQATRDAAHRLFTCYHLRSSLVKSPTFFPVPIHLIIRGAELLEQSERDRIVVGDAGVEAGAFVPVGSGISKESILYLRHEAVNPSRILRMQIRP